jgi:hypothetical protein
MLTAPAWRHPATKIAFGPKSYEENVPTRNEPLPDRNTGATRMCEQSQRGTHLVHQQTNSSKNANKKGGQKVMVQVTFPSHTEM